MSYEPTTWANGDIITAVKLNNIESGVQSVSSSYTPTTWATGDIITAVKLNNIEQGIANAGGGGSSDFSTAQVTVNGSGSYLMRGAFVTESWGKGGPATTTGTYYSDDYGYPGSFSVVMYKGTAVVEFDEQATITATGNATVDWKYVTITGDCTITVS